MYSNNNNNKQTKANNYPIQNIYQLRLQTILKKIWKKKKNKQKICRQFQCGIGIPMCIKNRKTEKQKIENFLISLFFIMRSILKCFFCFRLEKKLENKDLNFWNWWNEPATLSLFSFFFFFRSTMFSGYHHLIRDRSRNEFRELLALSKWKRKKKNNIFFTRFASIEEVLFNGNKTFIGRNNFVARQHSVEFVWLTYQYIVLRISKQIFFFRLI